MDDLCHRVAARYRLADLSPPLGDPGGPCQVIQRIQEEVRTPALQDHLIDEVEDGVDLANPEAAKIYHLDRELGVRFVRNILIGPHAQYRMDLRSITVKNVQDALAGFGKLVNDLKSRKHPGYDSYARQLNSGEPIKYTDRKLDLTVVFALEGRDTVKVITTYWPGKETPRIPTKGCPTHLRVAYRYLEAAFIPDKWVRAKKTELRKLLAQPASKDIWKVAEQVTLQSLVPYFEKFMSEFPVHIRAEASLKARIETPIHILKKIGQDLYLFEKAIEATPFPGRVAGAHAFLVWWISQMAKDIFEAKVKTLGDAVKNIYRLDPRMVLGLVERILRRATPEEKQAIEDSWGNDVEHDPRGQHASHKIKGDFFRRINLDGLVNKVLVREKVDFPWIPWVDNTIEMLAANYSEQALQDTGEYTEFDLHGMKIVVDDASLLPGDIQKYVRYMNEAYAALKSKGFGSAWYGTVFIQCGECGGVNRNTGGGTGGWYQIGKDTISVFNRPGDFIVELLVHELGHRYWFKQMSSTQRAKFESLVKVYKPSKAPPIPASKMLDAEKVIGEDANSFETAFNRFEEAMEGAHDTKQQDILIQEFAVAVEALVLKHDPQTDVYKALDDLTPSAWNPSTQTWDHSTPVEKAKEGYTGSSEAPEVHLRRFCLSDSVRKHFKDFYEANGEHREGTREWLWDARSLLKQKERAALNWLEAIKEAGTRTFEEGDTRPVPAVSDYGKSNIDEAWAEVFAHYVMGLKMNRDQVDSFKAVLKVASTMLLVERVVLRYLEAAFIPDKWVRAKKTELRKLLTHPASRDPWKVGEQVTLQYLVPYFEKFMSEFPVHIRAEASLKARIETPVHILEKIGHELYLFDKAVSDTPFPGRAAGAHAFLVWWVSQKAKEIFEAKVKTLGDAIKNIYRLDPRMVLGLVERILRKATPEERQAIEDSERNDIEHDPRIEHASHRVKGQFLHRINFDGLVNKVLVREKVDFPWVPWVDNTIEMLAANYSEQALQDTGEFTEFDLHGMKVVVDDASLIPGDIQKYVRYMNEAYAALKSKGFGSAWYGTVFIQCGECGGVNRNTGGGTGGWYKIQKDTVSIFERPGPFIVELLAHELGHRYWFKQISSTQRAKFESLVQVKAEPRLKDVPARVIEDAVAAARKDFGEFLEFLPTALKRIKADFDAAEKQEFAPTSKLTVADAIANELQGARMTSSIKYRSPPNLYDVSVPAFRDLIPQENYKKAMAARDALIEHLNAFEKLPGVGEYKPEDAQKNLTGIRAWLAEAWKLQAKYLTPATRYLSEVEEGKQSLPVPGDKRPVLPVSGYGWSNIDEAWAEVFAHYVLGMGMNRDQVDSFKSVLKMATLQPLPIKWKGDKATFAIGDMGYTIAFKRKSIRHPKYGQINGVEVGFYQTRSEGAPWQYLQTDSPEVNAFQVFGTVLQAVKEFAGKVSPPEYMWFVADEPSRVRLYDALLRRVDVPGYRSEVTGDGKYTLVREKSLFAADDRCRLISVPTERTRSMKTAADAHGRSIALMKFLARATKQLGVAKDVYVVGGAVRNFLIDQPIKDIDVVVDSIGAGKDSEWLAKKLQGVIPVQSNLTTNQYGVAILTIKGEWMLDDHSMAGEVIEIANARKESYGGEGGKGYKPHMVEPATIEEDLVRREFTFNTLLWRLLDLEHGPDRAEVIDLLGRGKLDLEKRQLQTPADPDKTFSDDPTRMLRAIKFVAKYGFKIPPDVVASIRRNAPKLKQMPWDAVRKILTDDILEGPAPRQSVKLMHDLGLGEVLKEMLHEEPGFAAGLGRSLNDQEIHLVLDLLDLDWVMKTPVGFLDRAQQLELRVILLANAGDPGFEKSFMTALTKPPVDQQRFFTELAIPPKERSVVTQQARRLLLDKPEYVMAPPALEDALEAILAAKYPRATTAEKVAARF